MKHRSEKRQAQEEEYYKIRKEYLEEHPYCELCASMSTDIHHKRARNGERLNDTSNFMSLCRRCHTKIETNREWAYSKEYLLKRNSKND